MNDRAALWLAISLCFLAAAARAGDFKIVPGECLGDVVLGRTEKQIRAALGAPNTVVRLEGGLVREDWLSPRLAPKAYVEAGLYFKHDFVTVYFRRDRAVQAEASSPAFKTPDGLTRASHGQKFRDRYPGFQTTIPPHVHNPAPNGCPAVKHFVAYDDSTAKGIAWRYGVWGNMAPDPDLETLEIVIVHERSQPVIVDPDGGVRLVWTVPPSDLLEHYPKK